jgi:hypothetical protein
MRGFLVFVVMCVAVAGCARKTPPPSPDPNATSYYQRELENQLGITRAKQLAQACKQAPPPSIGMTEKQALSSCWGKPDHAAESITAGGTQAVWSYPEGYVYLSNGFVTKIIVSR